MSICNNTIIILCIENLNERYPCKEFINNKLNINIRCNRTDTSRYADSKHIFLDQELLYKLK